MVREVKSLRPGLRIGVGKRVAIGLESECSAVSQVAIWISSHGAGKSGNPAFSSKRDQRMSRHRTPFKVSLYL
eukprot:4474862-Amphidinium_carterae.1